jgi:hypothetical protein
MPFANVFRPRRISAFPQRMSDSDALFRRKRNVLANIPAVSLSEVAALFYDAFHDWEIYLAGWKEQMEDGSQTVE